MASYTREQAAKNIADGEIEKKRVQKIKAEEQAGVSQNNQEKPIDDPLVLATKEVLGLSGLSTLSDEKTNLIKTYINGANNMRPKDGLYLSDGAGKMLMDVRKNAPQLTMESTVAFSVLARADEIQAAQKNGITAIAKIADLNTYEKLAQTRFQPKKPELATEPPSISTTVATHVKKQADDARQNADNTTKSADNVGAVTVKKGQTLSHIVAANKELLEQARSSLKELGGKPSDADAIDAAVAIVAKANGIANVHKIEAGKTFKLPDAKTLAKGIAEMKVAGHVTKDGHVRLAANTDDNFIKTPATPTDTAKLADKNKGAAKGS